MINRCTVTNDRWQIYRSIFKIAQGSVAKRVLNSLLLRSNYLAIKFAIKLVLITDVSPRGSIIMLQ